MKTTEIREIISESNIPTWFNSVETTIVYSKIGFSQSFIGISAIHKFLSQQIKGWDKYESIPSQLNSSKQHFTNLLNLVESFVNSYKNHKEPHLNSGWRNIQAKLQSDGNQWTYDSPETEFLIDLEKIYPNYVLGAYSYITGSFNPNSFDSFNGGLLAYEFRLKDHTELTQRRNKEKSSITKLKNGLREQLNETEIQLTEHLTKANQDYEKHVNTFDDLKSAKEEIFNDWFEGNNENNIIGIKDEINQFKDQKETVFNEWFEGNDNETGAKNKVKELEKTYEELLRLKKPAEYWKTRAKELKREGWVAVRWLMVLVAVAIISLYMLLWLTPEGMESSLDLENGNIGTAIRWSVIYVTFISFLAYGIRVLYKIAFSAFHLSRDSEEREQLTYVYLSLMNESTIDEKEKNLIMQSLFSRADTGLLKGDSSPAMPNDIVGKIFGQN